jgi:uncharacterized alpha-E superfamily protein
MTTRLLDAGAAVVLANAGNMLPSTEQLIWGNVLHSASAYLPYTRSQRKSVSGARVAQYLLEDANFPRTVACCAAAIDTVARHLPRSDKLRQAVATLREVHYGAFEDGRADINGAFRDYLNELQLRLAALHHIVADTWFDLD